MVACLKRGKRERGGVALAAALIFLEVVALSATICAAAEMSVPAETSVRELMYEAARLGLLKSPAGELPAFSNSNAAASITDNDNVEPELPPVVADVGGGGGDLEQTMRGTSIHLNANDGESIAMLADRQQELEQRHEQKPLWLEQKVHQAQEQLPPFWLQMHDEPYEELQQAAPQYAESKHKVASHQQQQRHMHYASAPVTVPGAYSKPRAHSSPVATFHRCSVEISTKIPGICQPIGIGSACIAGDYMEAYETLNCM